MPMPSKTDFGVRCSRFFHGLLLAAVVTITAGCPPKPEPAKSYVGPTDPLIKVVQDINQNNSNLKTIWSTHYYEANVIDPETGKKNFVNGNGAMLYRAPMGFRLVGKKDLVGDVFEVGSTDEHYWLKLVPEADRMWFGEHRHSGKPCVRKIPIQPNLVLDVLGIGVIGTDFTQMPTPVMRYNPDADVYMLVWVSTVGGAGAGPQRLAAQREVWYDRQTKLPKLVILFDRDGRPVLRANLSGHKPVEVPDLQPGTWPKIATQYKLYFPESGSTMSITLDEVKLDNKGVPLRRGIVFPGATPDEAGVREVIKLDQDCKD